MNEKLKCFNIEVEDIENINFENGMIQQIARKISDEYDLKRFELVLNENIITAKDKFTGLHSYMGMKVSLEPLEKDISFIVRPTNEPTYDDLLLENKQLKHILDELEKWAKEGMETGTHLAYECDLDFEDVLNKLKELRGDKNV